MKDKREAAADVLYHQSILSPVFLYPLSRLPDANPCSAAASTKLRQAPPAFRAKHHKLPQAPFVPPPSLLFLHAAEYRPDQYRKAALWMYVCFPDHREPASMHFVPVKTARPAPPAAETVQAAVNERHPPFSAYPYCHCDRQPSGRDESGHCSKSAHPPHQRASV